MWWQDMQELMRTYDAEPNLAYYVPYFRSDNCSHCVSIPPIGNPPIEPTDNAKVLTQPWLGSEIPQDMVDLKQFSTDLVNDTKPLKSYVQDLQPNEMFTPQESASWPTRNRPQPASASSGGGVGGGVKPGPSSRTVTRTVAFEIAI